MAKGLHNNSLQTGEPNKWMVDDIIEQIKSEVERLKFNYAKRGYTIVISAFKHLQDFLSTLESEKPMNQDELEEEIERYLPKIPEEPYNEELRVFARYFAQWGAEHRGSSETLKDLEEAACKYHRTHTDEVMDYDGYHNGNTKEVYDVTPGESFIAGWMACKDQMMKEALEGEIFDYYDKDICEHHLTILCTVPSRYKDGDKVRIIIVKEEGKRV